MGTLRHGIAGEGAHAQSPDDRAERLLALTLGTMTLAGPDNRGLLNWTRHLGSPRVTSAPNGRPADEDTVSSPLGRGLLCSVAGRRRADSGIRRPEFYRC